MKDIGTLLGRRPMSQQKIGRTRPTLTPPALNSAAGATLFAKRPQPSFDQSLQADTQRQFILNDGSGTLVILPGK